MTPSDVLRRATDSYAPYLGDDGHLNDPVIGMPNRRGLCGLYRVDLAEPCDLVTWRARIAG